MNNNFTEEQLACANIILQWINRMNEKNGPYVYDCKGNELDWGQALSREAYGKDWASYMAVNNIVAPDRAIVGIAEDWEGGNIPSWIAATCDDYDEHFEYFWEDEDEDKDEDDENLLE